ncbi:LPXTG cell wall anchor domain-containing protein [Haloactinopolyspora alba]|uniref:LPXTG cell wall anchor domain-containing protein n=1 Tax=Haloactinopolyspora alba TaxID=648780 RepID=UPI000D0D4358|nr:LPXTG cell wall anchor domain-containing protein [Haloactinopolyspora alba]
MGVVATTTTASAEESLSETLQTFAADAFTEQAADLPSGLTQAIERDLGLSPAEYLANAAAAKSAADVVAELEAAGVSINGSVISGQDLTVYVEAEADVPLVESVGATVEVGEPPESDSGDLEKPELYAQDDFKGGYGYATLDDIENPSGAGRCSAGFNGTNADGSPIIYTAGHCGADYEQGHPWFHLPVDSPLFGDESWASPELANNPQLGENGPMEFGGGNDGGLVNVTDDWTLPPQVAYWGGGTGAPDDGESVDIYDSTDPIVGQPACKSGATSGWTCGEVLHAEDTVDVAGTDVTSFVFTACMLSGDSGGSIVSGNYALGVDSWSTEQAMNCDGWDPATEYEVGGFANGDIGGGFAVTSGSANAETLFGDGFNLSIHVGTPSVTAPEDGATTGPTPTVEGTVEAAKGATVTVEIENGPTVEGKVAANGSFSADVAEALEPGTYNYTATASHTANGANQATTSESTSGSFQVAEAPEVEKLAVDQPSEGQTTGNPRPDFTGTGHPGATVSLSVGGNAYGEAEVAEDGSWTITPNADLPIGVRFDAVLTQTFENDTQEVTVADLGIEAADVTISVPEDGSTVNGDVTFEGTAFPGATVGLMLEPAGATDEADANSASSEQLSTQADGNEDAAPWPGEFNIDDEGNWTFNPDEPVAAGDYTVTATASLDGGDPELSESEASASFTVANPDNGDESGDESGDAGGAEGGDEDLPDTGSSNTWMIYVGIGLLVAGGAAVAIRARRNSSTA